MLHDLKKNKALWDTVKFTHPNAVTEVPALSKGNQKFLSVNSYWVVMRMTEIFGSIGDGWGFKVLQEGFHNYDENHTIHTAHVQLWYKTTKNGEKFYIEQMGTTKAKYLDSHKKIQYDWDAPKKSVTDAMKKCCSQIGLMGDVHLGEFNPNESSNFYQYFYIDQADHQDQQDHEVDQQPKQQVQQDQEQELKSILLEINNAANYKILGNIYRRYEDRNFAPRIQVECDAVAKRNGWSKSSQKNAV